jgi:hypothetical protein
MTTRPGLIRGLLCASCNCREGLAASARHAVICAYRAAPPTGPARWPYRSLLYVERWPLLAAYDEEETTERLRSLLRPGAADLCQRAAQAARTARPVSASR